MQIDQVEDGVFQSMCPDPAEVERAETIGYIAHQMQHAGPSQDNIAFRLDMALLLLEKHAFGKNAQQLEDDEFRLLASALAVASTRAFDQPPSGLTNHQVMSGTLLISQILMFWALPDEQRLGATLLKGHLKDLARVLRNHMHNANLLNRVLEDICSNRLGGARGASALGLPADPANTMKLFIRSMTAPGYSDAA